ncbi:T-cell surface antigen CD2-like [Thunnus maccoyii]|uniref:T-cell surface antigen CD2-like n=1 Tax=Thunnus maccoyii TaxID=8240 RepID=UPI001C4DB517|nr:T-cell surface antigen CD2-like [Thunnus maccoyii]
MEKPTSCFLSVLLLLAVPSSVSAEDAFFGEGGELRLRPSFSKEITSIQWKHNNDLVAEWVKDIVVLQDYGDFKNRTTLNIITGDLEIRNMSRDDNGVYSVEINNNVQPERYNAKLIGRVPKPAVLVGPLTCTDKSQQCTLTCDGYITGAEPVTFSWKNGKEEWKDGKKVRDITNDETTQRVEMFSCRMKNPISEEKSKPKDNPFYRIDPVWNPVPAVVGGVVGGLVLIALVVLGVRKREVIGKRIEAWRNPDSCNNGNVNPSELTPCNKEDAEENNGKPAAEV